jgi:hypothetical protein
MATVTGNYVCDNSTLANFQNWTNAIYNALIAFGWLQTADTGQAAAPIAAVPSNGYVYWIFKAADTLASTLPIYLKIELGYNSSIPGIRMTVGTGSNGAGVITNTCTSAPWETTYASSWGNRPDNMGDTTFPCYFSGHAGEFRMYLWQSATRAIGVFFGIERSKDASGNDTGEYFTALEGWKGSNAQTQYQQTIFKSSVANLESGTITVPLTSASGTGAYAGSVASLPIFPVYGRVGNPMLGWQAACASDLTDGTICTIDSLYGAAHTFVAITGSQISTYMARSANPTAMGLLMRYE